MASRRKKGRGVFYTRDSGGEHENTPGEYVRWAQRMATEHGVQFHGTPEQIEGMIRDGLFEHHDIFLDYGVKGNLLQRRGLDALFRIVHADSNVSHVFIPRRDRFARPDAAVDGVQLESRLRKYGVTLVFMDKVLSPSGRQDIGESIVAMVDYERAGMERRDLAQKIIFAQINLAKHGYSTGGRPPFGFRRWLVQADGTAVRQLAEGENVRMAGHHVIWLPGPEEEINLVRRILLMLETMPACRVAAMLTKEGIPAPDAGRLRTDRGVKHRTSGVWHQTTIVGIARNPLLQMVVEYGRRSMGDQLRFTPEGPRELDDTDQRSDGKPKVVINTPETRIVAPVKFEPLVDAERHRQLLAKLNERAGSQRGKPRSQDPDRNPLGGRIFDMECGWPLYRQPYGSSFRYLCGLYQQSHGAKCRHNHVEGLLATRFLLGCIRQRLCGSQLREKLEQKLRAIATRQLSGSHTDSELAAKRTALAGVRAKRELAAQNLALAASPEHHKAVAEVFDQLQRQEGTLESELARLERLSPRTVDVDVEVQAALSCLDRLVAVADNPKDLVLRHKLNDG